MQNSKLIVNDRYILCLCEGAAETAVMEILLENQKLVFDKKDLLYYKVHQRKSVKSIEEEFLNQGFEKDLLILRIIDCKHERFILGRAYRDRFQIETYRTSPEIEILIIINEGDYSEYSQKYKSKQSPNEYCKMKYKYSSVKNSEFVRKYFSDVDRLVDSIKTHKTYTGGQTICDLLRE